MQYILAHSSVDWYGGASRALPATARTGALNRDWYVSIVNRGDMQYIACHQIVMIGIGGGMYTIDDTC
jgi:hypothetical protein